ncbi:MAG: NUDIX domain-containing protein [Erysipelotrichaceae bacterium]|jgi:ADP-ribose pyrophosphatase
MKKKEVEKEKIKVLHQSEFLNFYDIGQTEGKSYYQASRRKKEDLVVLKSNEQLKKMNADGVGCVVIVKGQEDRLFLNHEYRYPVGEFVLSVPAGLYENENEDVFEAAKREIREETGLKAKEIRMISPLLFSSPGMTDETNAMVCVFVDDIEDYTSQNCEGGELFKGYSLLTKKQAIELLDKVCDEHNNYFSVYTHFALLYFISELWKKGD